MSDAYGNIYLIFFLFSTANSFLMQPICKSRNGELGNGAREMRGMEVGMQGIGVKMQRIWVGMRGTGVGMRGIGVGMRRMWGME